MDLLVLFATNKASLSPHARLKTLLIVPPPHIVTTSVQM